MTRIVCDETKCIGCLACIVSCIDHHYDLTDQNATPLIQHIRKQLPSGYMQYFPKFCYHCEDAPCIENCPEDALWRDEYGFVQVNREICSGCRICAHVCPFDVPSFDSDEKMVKCDGCKGNPPACISACPTDALTLVVDASVR